ncbi:MAG: phosphotransferase enzyme family protein [Gemmobacter sp.]
MPDTALRALLPAYGLPKDAPLRLMHRSENDTWLAGDGAGALVLRQHRAGYHSKAEIAAELAWLAALQGLPGLRCPRPVPAGDGRLILTAGGRFVCAFAFVPGREPQPEDDLAPWFEDIGAISARLHRHARSWPRPPGFIRKRWDVATILGPRPHWGDWRAAPDLGPAGIALLQRLSDDLAARLGAYGTGPGRFGLIHADLRLANLLIDDRGLWAIDFDDCGFGWRMYDFAASVSFIEHDPRLPELAARWCAGYERTGLRLSPEDRAILPVLVMLRRLLLTAWAASRADSDTVREIGLAAYVRGTLELAERHLTGGLARGWR